MSEVNYSYADGMSYVDKFIHAGEYHRAYSGLVEPRRLVIPDTADVQMALARIHDEIERPYIKKVETAHGSCDVEYSILNRDVPAKKIMAMFVDWGGSFQNPVGEREYAAIALQFPDTHILAINFPGSAGSDNLPPSIARKMVETGSYMPAGELLEPVVGEVFEDYEERMLAGSSHGARTALAVGVYRDTTEIVRVVEPLGARAIGFKGIMAAFMKREAGHAAKYQQASPDAVSAAIQRKNDSLPNLLRTQLAAVRRGSWRTLMIHMPQVMGGNGLGYDLMLLLPKVSRELTVVTPEKSELSDPAAVLQVMTSAALVASGVPRVYRQRVLPDRTHSYLSGVPAAQASVLSTS